MSELFDKGFKVRKEVLGEDYVNKSIAGADEFTRTMAEWSTEFCWGALWTRPGIDRRTRSIVNLAMLGALNRPHELKLHVKGALKNGVTKDEIKEILLAGRRLLRRACRYRCLPQRARGAQRSRNRSSEARASGSRMAEPEYELFAIRYATREARRSDHFIGGDPHDGPMPMDYFMWVAKGGGRTFVIDTGFNAEVANEAETDLPALSGGDARRCSTSMPNAVEDVILTHLHYDHVGKFRPLSPRAISSPGARTGLCHRALHAVPEAVAFLRSGGRLRHRAAELCAPRHVLQRRCGARARPDGSCGRRPFGRTSIRSRQDPPRALSCSRPTSAISTRTWRASVRSRRRCTSAKCSRVSKNCSRWRRTRATSCPVMTRW